MPVPALLPAGRLPHPHVLLSPSPLMTHLPRKRLSGRLFVASGLAVAGYAAATGRIVLYALAPALVVIGLAHHAQAKKARRAL